MIHDPCKRDKMLLMATYCTCYAKKVRVKQADNRCAEWEGRIAPRVWEMEILHTLFNVLLMRFALVIFKRLDYLLQHAEWGEVQSTLGLQHLLICARFSTEATKTNVWPLWSVPSDFAVFTEPKKSSSIMKLNYTSHLILEASPDVWMSLWHFWSENRN